METTIDKYAEMAFSNPEMLINNYLYNREFVDFDKWDVIDKRIYKEYPYLSILLLFGDSNGFKKEEFIDSNRDTIKKESDNLASFMNQFSPFIQDNKEQLSKALKENQSLSDSLRKESIKSQVMILASSKEMVTGLVMKYSHYDKTVGITEVSTETYDYIGLQKTLESLGISFENDTLESHTTYLGLVNYVLEKIKLAQNQYIKEYSLNYDIEECKLIIIDEEKLAKSAHDVLSKLKEQIKEVLTPFSEQRENEKVKRIKLAVLLKALLDYKSKGLK